MAESSGSGARVQVFQQQADAAISQANPVSTTLYEVLATTKNVRIISIAAYVTWAVTQPTPLEVVVSIDGITKIYLIINPVSATTYHARPTAISDDNNQTLDSSYFDHQRAFLLEGRSVRVQVRVTWAITQPSPLVCRVKYAKIP